jgi:serine/threonine protein phosphatase PrpC
MDLHARASLELHSYGGSDIGRRRRSNEDAYLCDDEIGLWIVADGMGGHAAGEVASHEACEAIWGMVKRGAPNLEASPPEGREQRAVRLLEGAVQSATYMVYAMAELDSGKAGMGTTISAMLRSGQRVLTAQVGDSRIYRVRGGRAEQLTEDHTLVAWQIKQGLITEQDARTSKQRNVITRAVGNRDYVQVDITWVDLQIGDVFLLCSDGLHGYLELEEVAGLAATGGDLAVHRFIELANSRGGRDNITAVVVEVW